MCGLQACFEIFSASIRGPFEKKPLTLNALPAILELAKEFPIMLRIAEGHKRAGEHKSHTSSLSINIQQQFANIC